MPFKPSDFGTPIMLTLRRRSDRLAMAMREVHDSGWPFAEPRVVYGIDGHAPGFAPPNWIRSEIGQTISNGAWGCTLSYNNIICEFLESGDEWRMIVEDDVWLVDGFAEKVTAFLANVPDDADSIYVGGNPRYPIQYPPVEINEFVCRPWRLTATHCFMIRRRFAMDLMPHLLGSPAEICDMRMARLHSMPDASNKVHGGKYNIYFTREPLAGQVLGLSDIMVFDGVKVEKAMWSVSPNRPMKQIGDDVTQRVGGAISADKEAV